MGSTGEATAVVGTASGWLLTGEGTAVLSSLEKDSGSIVAGVAGVRSLGLKEEGLSCGETSAVELLQSGEV